MSSRHGNLSINSDNIFPIIKKWLYSDHDIFYRELISNGCDAITKLKKLDLMGEYELPQDFEPKIQIVVNPEEKTLKFIDNGLGMTGDEVEEYINQIAFSGATDFLENIRTRPARNRLSAISGWASILPLWWRTPCTLIPFPGRKTPCLCTGNVTAGQNLTCPTAPKIP